MKEKALDSIKIRVIVLKKLLAWLGRFLEEAKRMTYEVLQKNV